MKKPPLIQGWLFHWKLSASLLLSMNAGPVANGFPYRIGNLSHV